MKAALPAALLFAFACAGPALAQHPALTAPLAAPADPAGYQRTLEAAEAAIAASDFAAAEPLLERATADYALDARAWTLLGDAKRQLQKPAEAIAAYQRAIALAGPGYRWSRQRVALLQMQLGDHEAALDTLEAIVFEDAYLQRPGLMLREEYAPLRDNPRFRRIAGYVDTNHMTREAGWRGDLDYLLTEIRRLNPHYRQGDLPAEITAIHRDLYENVATLSDEQIFAGLSRLTGALDQNHTMMWGIWFDGPRPTTPDLNYLPLQLYLFPEGVFIVAGSDPALIGAEVLAIDGEPVANVLGQVRTAISARGASEAAWITPMRLTDLALLRGLGVTARSDRAALRLRLPGGRTVTRTLTGADMPVLGKLQPPPNVAAPLFLARVGEAHWFEPWEAMATIYAQVNQIAPDEDETLPAFALRLREALHESQARNLIIDLRNNNGGNTFTYPELLRTIIAFSADEDHRVYVLIGRMTYSAAANFTTELQRLANPIFVGEPSGAIGNQDGDEGLVRLPYSGLYATIAGVWWQLSDPWDERGSQAPHAPVQLTARDYFAGRDPALDTVRAMIGARAGSR